VRNYARMATKKSIGESISDEQMKALRLQAHKFHPDWNYTLLP